jgi:hypothetical protein
MSQTKIQGIYCHDISILYPVDRWILAINSSRAAKNLDYVFNCQVVKDKSSCVFITTCLDSKFLLERDIFESNKLSFDKTGQEP